MRVIDLTGERFGRLTVVERVANIGNVVAWLCACDCGNSLIVRSDSLRKGKTKSCGCLKRETATVQALKNSKAKFRGEKITSNGYSAIYSPDNQLAVCTGYALEHRLVAERMIGRQLEKSEVVHHINGVRTDNRPENLRVMSRSEHQKLHMKERKEKLLRRLVNA